jgi:hypothetical protein
MIRRREFTTLLGAAQAWPLSARAQQTAMPVVGFVRLTTPEDSAHLVAAFKQGLGESGFVEGRPPQQEQPSSPTNHGGKEDVKPSNQLVLGHSISRSTLSRPPLSASK